MHSGHSIFNQCQHRLICLLLCVTVWNGPVPVLHSHEVYSDTSSLQVHIDEFHSGVKCSVSSEPHWHLVFVDELAHDLTAGETSHDCPVLPLQVMQESPVASDCTVCAESSDAWHWMQVERLRRGPRECANLPHSFLSSLLCDVPLVAISGVCLI
jgi:hypothetical protein